GRALHQQSGRTRRPHDEGQAENLRRLPLHRRCNRLCGDPLLHLHRQKAGLERHPGHRPRPANPDKFSTYGLIRHNASRQTSWAVTVFFKTRPIVLSLALSTILSSTTFSSSNRNVHRARPAGGSEQAKAISFASFSPSKIRGTAGMARCLRLRTASKPSST